MQRIRIASLAAAALIVGCSSSDFQTAATDSGATTDDSGVAQDTAPGCVVPPTATAGEGDFCEAFAQYESRCGHCEACVQTNANNCIAFGQGVSDVLERAFVACAPSLGCGSQFGDWAKDPCVQAHVASATPSEKQKAAKDAYCAACPTNAYECEHFFGGDPDAGTDGGVNDLGAYVLAGNDDAVQKMIDNCTGGGNCGAVAYVLCTAIQFCGPVPADACGSKFCNK